MTYTAIKSALDATWRDQPHHVRVLAARFYANSESIQTLRAQTTERPCHRHAVTRPCITPEQCEFIINMR